jgi:hypothetical protein
MKPAIIAIIFSISAVSTVAADNRPEILGAIATHSTESEIGYVSIHCTDSRVVSGIMRITCVRAKINIVKSNGQCQLKQYLPNIMQFSKWKDGVWISAQPGSCNYRADFVLIESNGSWSYSEIVYNDNCKQTIYLWMHTNGPELSCPVLK